jgi:phospholipid/cholesterol/gamma-HCH transport system substrate-binding protein
MGVILVVTLLLVGYSLFQKTHISTSLKSGDTVKADFDRDYRLRPYVTKVKVAGVRVGLVVDVQRLPSGRARVSMKLDSGNTTKLRSTPSAAIRATTLLGGNYYVDLRPGGDPAAFGGVIPSKRTTTPVELDRVLEVLKPDVRTSTQRTVRRLDATLDTPGRRAVSHLLGDAPQTLNPVGRVLRSAQGTRPSRDLATAVTGLEHTARALTRGQGDLSLALKDLQTTSSVLDRNSGHVASAVDDLPRTLRSTRVGLLALNGTLDRLHDTAGGARPTVRRLDTTLRHLHPALVQARPLVRELRPLLADLRPAVDELVPTSTSATKVLDNIDGPSLKRLNGPVLKTVLSPWKGKGQYDTGGNSTPLYKELGNLVAGMDNASKMTDRNGSTIHFQPGFGVGSVSGTPVSFEKIFRQLLYPNGSQ